MVSNDTTFETDSKHVAKFQIGMTFSCVTLTTISTLKVASLKFCYPW